MARIKRGKTKKRRKKSLLKHAKGFRWGRKSKYRQAKQALQKAWTYAYRDRRVKKREKRQLWQIQISSLCKQNSIPYSRFINNLKNHKVLLNRKVLSQLARENPDIFKRIIEQTK